MIWILEKGEYPDGFIDHINGVITDNRIENLRLVSPQENTKNISLSCRNTSGCLGVSRGPSGTWLARIQHEGKSTHIGSYQDKSHAIIARQAAEKVLGFHPNHGRPPNPLAEADGEDG